MKLTYTITSDITSYSVTDTGSIAENAANKNQLTITESIYYGIDGQGFPYNTIVDTTPDTDNFTLGTDWGSVLLLSKKFATLNPNVAVNSTGPAPAVVTTSTVNAADPSLYNVLGSFDMSYATTISTGTVGGGGNNNISYTTVTSSQLTVEYDYMTPCFLAGAMVLTADGERPIETLTAGDLVVARRDGVESLRPVLWVGEKRMTASRLRAAPLDVAPIRVRAGALGEASPSRDMLVSPCHALLIDGLMVQAGALVNGTSVSREFFADAPFTYYHVELDGHWLIVVDGVEAETFLDSVSVMAFDNGRDRPAPLASAQGVDELPYPRVTSARQLPRRVREALAVRAGRNGHDQAAQAA